MTSTEEYSILCFGISFGSVADSIVSEDIHASIEYTLLPPLSVDIILEESIFMRKSVRDFTEDDIEINLFGVEYGEHSIAVVVYVDGNTYPILIN